MEDPKPDAPSSAGISAGEYLRAPATERLDITPTAVAREEALRRQHRPDDAGPFSDIRRARRRRALARRVAAWLAPPLVASAIAAAWWGRAELAGRWPTLRPALAAACAPFGCTVPPWRDLRALRIDGSQLEWPARGDDAYLLSLILHNDSQAAVALPDLELTLAAADGRIVASHRFAPSDYLAPAQRAALDAGLNPGDELPLQVRFRTQAHPPGGGPDAVSYRVRIRYR